MFYEHDYRRKILHNVVISRRPIIKKETVFDYRKFFVFMYEKLAN